MKVYLLQEVGEVWPISAGDDAKDIYIQVYEDGGGEDETRRKRDNNQD